MITHGHWGLIISLWKYHKALALFDHWLFGFSLMIWKPLTVNFKVQTVMVRWVCLEGVHLFKCRGQTKWHVEIPSFAHLWAKSSRMTYSRRFAVLCSSKTVSLCIINSGVGRGTTKRSPFTYWHLMIPLNELQPCMLASLCLAVCCTRG